MLYQIQPTLKVTRINVNASRQSMDIEAAPDGVLATILKMFGIRGQSRLVVDPTGLRLRESRFSGQQQTYCPLANMAASVFTRTKPVGLLALAGFVSITATTSVLGNQTFVVGIILYVIAAICCATFFLSKQRATIGVVTNAATAEVLKLKATASELRELEAAAAVIERLLGGRQESTAPPEESLSEWEELESEPVPPSPPRLPSEAETFTLRCEHCGSNLRLKQNWRGKTISCPACKQKQYVPG